jgi:hypothetical protein
MKPTRILFCAVVAGLTAIATGNAQVIIQNRYPLATLNICGVFTWNGPGGYTGTYTIWENARARFNSKDLIEVLNSSGTFTNVLYNVKGVTQIPEDSSLMLDINRSWSVFVTNRNGFSILLTEVYDPEQNEYFTFCEVDHDNWTGSSQFHNVTDAGRETDLVNFHLTFSDGEGVYFEFGGVGKFEWAADPRETSVLGQKVSVSGKIKGGGDAIYQGYHAVLQATVKAKGKGMVTSFSPFQMWWPSFF